jgi:hypothetical protein
MRTDDLRSLSQIGQALWVSAEDSERITTETLMAISRLSLSPEQALERTSGVLLQRAIQGGSSATMSGVENPFFRLAPEERFMLSALHSGRWTYERVGRVLDRTAEQISEFAWSVRLGLASHAHVLYPTGSTSRAPTCPEYNIRQPWTQRFLDQELSARERMYFQNHLNGCVPCRQTLMRCRNLYYTVEKMIPKLDPELDQKRVYAFERSIYRVQRLFNPGQASFGEGILTFMSSSWVPWVLVAVFLLMIFRLFS